jgi:DNA-binding response OmpR family regulator
MKESKMNKTEKKKIYLIDDDPVTGKTIAHMVRQYTNYDVKYFCNIKKALSSIKKQKPDLILLDWMMPDMSGLEILAELKQNKKTKEISIFMLTGKRKGDDFMTACHYGVDGYFTKPVDMLYIKNSLISHLNAKSTLNTKKLIEA